MSVTEFPPATDWREHIAAYWVRRTGPATGADTRPGKGPDTRPSGRRVYANGCADLICNAGESTAYFYPMAGEQPAIPLHPGRLYLGGTMTAYGVLRSDAGSLFTGIRFWPGGFYALFSQTMQPAVDSLIEFPAADLCTLMQHTENLDTRLDRWFGDRSAPGTNVNKYDFAYLRKRMYDSKGQVSVEALAKEISVSKRTLERIFKENVGIPPKEFLRIIRFQEVLSHLRVGTSDSLLQLAFELGYYDHAHLTNEFKKYAGILPSELSHFYKTGISGGHYF